MTKTDKGYIGVGMEGPIATWYARNTAKDLNRHQGLARRLASSLPAGSRVLEVAPGPGYFCIELAKVGQYQISGLDISKTFVEIARQNAVKAGVNVDFRLGNAADMPFSDSSFDLIVCQAAFKNFSQPVKAITEMYRVLRPGGTALIIDLSRDASPQAIDHEVAGMGVSALNRAFIRWSFRGMLLKRAYTKQEMQAFAAQTPFRAGEIKESGIGFEVSLKKPGI
jgi:ubiquinone/menaquinone biosynthesis C-methylase UbiE